jgi:hypothetical protein
MTNGGMGLRRMDDGYYTNCMTTMSHRRGDDRIDSDPPETVRMADHVP